MRTLFAAALLGLLFAHSPSETDREELAREGVPLPKPFPLKKSAR